MCVYMILSYIIILRKRHVLPMVHFRRQPINRLDHLFSAVKNASSEKIQDICDAILDGSFFRSFFEFNCLSYDVIVIRMKSVKGDETSHEKRRFFASLLY